MIYEAKNLFYVSNFNVIGGVETYIFELARKYDDYDIMIVYKTGDRKQLQRLKKHVRVIKHLDENQYKCEQAIFNYETDIIDNVEAKEYIQLIHAMFKTQKNLTPIINPKITKYFAVSKSAKEEWEELTGLDVQLNYNPLSITDEEKEPVLLLISATRLTDEKRKMENAKTCRRL